MLEQISSIRLVIGSNGMAIFIKHILANRSNQQIKRSVTCLLGTLLFCAGCLLAALLSQEDGWVFVGAGLFALIYGLLAVRNDRVKYDGTGITLYSVWGKPFHKNWSDVMNVDVVEEPLISKQLFVGRVLRIICKEKNGVCTTTYRFPYRYYIGINDFLSFYSEFILHSPKRCREDEC